MIPVLLALLLAGSVAAEEVRPARGLPTAIDSIEVIPEASWPTGDTARVMAAIAPSSDGAIEKLLEKQGPRENEWVYQSLFASPDAQIYNSMATALEYHEQQKTRFLGTSQRGLFHQLPPSATSTQLAREVDVRAGFAQGVMRLKTDALIRNVLAPKGSTLRGRVETVQKKLDQVKNTSVPLGGGAPGSGFSLRMQFGYDVMTDASKFELVSDKWWAGVYHTRLLGSLSGSSVPAESFSLKIGATLDPDTGASVALVPNSHFVEGGLSRRLSRSWQAYVSTLVPTSSLRPDTRYQISLTHSF